MKSDMKKGHLSPTQLTETVLMISPDQFQFNKETALTNFFQKSYKKPDYLLRKKAIKEFNTAVKVLRNHNIDVLVLNSPKITTVPDAVFPNNWLSSHAGGLLVIYPMLTINRRKERQIKKLKKLLKSKGVKISKVINLTKNEQKGKILEGTGSMVLDRVNKIAFAMESSRTVKEMFDYWCDLMGYRGVFLQAYDKDNMSIYHTNVMMSVGDGFAVACLEVIKNPKTEKKLESELKKFNRELIPINLKQVYSFCGNILHVLSKNGKPKIIMSKNAYNSFTNEQKAKLKKYGDLVCVNIPTIEYIGGGSARCMLAEIFRA